MPRLLWTSAAVGCRRAAVCKCPMASSTLPFPRRQGPGQSRDVLSSVTARAWRNRVSVSFQNPICCACQAQATTQAKMPPTRPWPETASARPIHTPPRRRGSTSPAMEYRCNGRPWTVRPLAPTRSPAPASPQTTTIPSSKKGSPPPAKNTTPKCRTTKRPPAAPSANGQCPGCG